MTAVTETDRSMSIRDMRESKQLSQDAVAAACGLSYSKFVRIEEGSGRTTQAEIDAVMGVLQGMEPGKRKLAGRPFKDPAKNEAVRQAREEGKSVAEVLGFRSTVETPAETEVAAEPEPAGDGEAEETPTQRKARQARERRAAKKAEAAQGDADVI